MKKTILFLMNGFGIEQVDSYRVYNSNLMPNLESYIKQYLFTKINTNSYDMESGYRKFSTGLDYPLTYMLIDKISKKFDNENITSYISSIKDNAKIHLYLFLENEKNNCHLKSFVTAIRKLKSNPIFLHLVLTSKYNDDFKKIEKLINKIMIDCKNVTIATIIGQDNLSDKNIDSYLKMLQNEDGEKLKNLTKKFTSLTKSKILPIDTKEFYVNNGFKIDDNDSFFFFNYQEADLTNFSNKIKVDMTSMFKINGIKNTMFSFPKSGKSTTNSLKKINAKAVLLTKKENISSINYYLCGLENIIPDNILYADITNDALLNQTYVKSIIDNEEHNLIIIDCNIGDVKNIDELTSKLSEMDEILGYVHDHSKQNGYTLFITSLYGMKKILPLDDYIKSNIDFSYKLPVIIMGEGYTKNKFDFEIGDIYNLAHTIYNNIDSKYNIDDVIIKKKGFFSKLLKK